MSVVAHTTREKEEAYRSLYRFVCLFWNVIDKNYVDNWHIRLICDALQSITLGTFQARDLVICIPPGYAKSLLTCVFWPAWEWLRDPTIRTLYCSHDPSVANRDSMRTRSLIETDQYQALLKYVLQVRTGKPSTLIWTFSKVQNEKNAFDNTERGSRMALGLKYKVTGKRADKLVIDDPYDVKDIVLGDPEQVMTRIKEVDDIVDIVLSTRVNDERTSKRVLIMQRVHDKDLAGRMIAEGAAHLVLPATYNPAHKHVCKLDPRQSAGEALSPRAGLKEFARARASLGIRHYRAQYEQDPRPFDAGGVFQPSWFRKYEGDTQRDEFEQIGISVDCTFKKSDDSDFVSIQVWGKRKTMRVLLDQKLKRMDYVETRTAIVAMLKKWPRAQFVLVEDKANGPAIIADLGQIIDKIIPYTPKDSKQARANAASVVFETGNVRIAENLFEEFRDELCAFPRGEHDDQVDACSQILIRWSNLADRTAADKWLETARNEKAAREWR